MFLAGRFFIQYLQLLCAINMYGMWCA
jgi:hypothetical protein